EWDSLYSEIEKSLPEYEKYRGRLGESAQTLAEAISFTLDTGRSIERLYVYAHLKSDEDKSNQQYLGMYQRAISLYTQAAELASFFTPEIQNIDDDRIKAFLEDDILMEYRFYLEKMLRYKPHTHEEKIERILAMSQDFAHGVSQVFGQLDNVDLKFGDITDETGETIELSHGNFSTFLINPDREIRKEAFHQYYSEYKDHENTFASTLLYSNKKNIFYSKVRNFDSARSAALFSDDVPSEVYDNLVSTVHDTLEPLFDYFRFRKETLGLDELHFYDTYVPIVPDIRFSMPYEEAVNVCIKALAPLGKEYTDILKEGLVGGWVDRYENRGKRSGAYSSGCYDSPPYILMNYQDKNINSLYTLTHEAGHSMHSYLSKNNQPYVDHEYTIFVAEVASTFNETLLSGYLLNLYKDDPAMKAYILNREVDNFRATLYRQTMFAEFEKVAHSILEQNQPLTLDVIRAEYRKLLETYFGDTMFIDPDLELECLRIPHFYSAFYVYKYATGISAAIALADRVLKGKEEERDSYLNFLKLGGSKFPLDELAEAGVDMRSPEPVKQAIAHFEKRVRQLKDEIIKTSAAVA
ncbi:MAG: oligoendopeptidase F, partial [Deltaproteobacteria bacterium]|nr:oligoendopeptidase F [Deltaproteobacteria bacterium]